MKILRIKQRQYIYIITMKVIHSDSNNSIRAIKDDRIARVLIELSTIY